MASEKLQMRSSCSELRVATITAGWGRGGGKRSRAVFKMWPLSNWSSEMVHRAAGNGSLSSHKAAWSHRESLIHNKSFALMIFIKAMLKSQMGHRLKEQFNLKWQFTRNYVVPNHRQKDPGALFHCDWSCWAWKMSSEVKNYGGIIIFFIV